MENKRDELLKGTVLVGVASIATLLVDPTGMSCLLIGVLGSAAYEGVKKLKGSVRAFVPREIFLPDQPLNQALARSITKAVHFAAGPDALQAFRETPSWQKLTVSEKELVSNFCDELRQVAAGEVHSSLLASGVGRELEKKLLEASGPEEFEQLKATLKERALFGFPESFVEFLFRRIEEHVGAFFWAEVVGSDPENGPWREYATLVLRNVQDELASLGAEATELRRLLEARESEMKPHEVVSQINTTVEAHVAELSEEEQSHFEALKQLSLDVSADVRAGTQATIGRIDDAKKLLEGQLDEIQSGVQELRSSSALQKASLEELAGLFAAESSEVVGWARVLSTGETIPRSELETLRKLLDSKQHSTTLLLGPPGSGKSALLAEFAQALVDAGTTALGFRSDTLPRDIREFEEIIPTLPGSEGLCDAIRRMGAERGIVVLIDQLDSVSSIVDKHPERLNLVLRLIRFLHKAPGVHIIAACREFEREHDPRLSTLDYEPIRLELPRWETVAEILNQHGFSVPEKALELREILRTPLHLSDFLKDADPGDEFSSVQGLLEKVWEKRLESHEEAELLELVARRMLNEEELWIPKSAADGHKEAFEALVRKELLQVRRGGRVIGFHHQTYFDFALARAFSNVPGFSISHHVLSDGHDGLFVRPLLISVLTYLRGTSLKRYHKEIGDLLGGARLHVRQLVVGLIGMQKIPTPDELAALLGRLDSPEDRPRALQSLSSTQGGVRALLDHEDFVARCMADDLNLKNELSGFLASSGKFFPDEVSALVKTHWLPHESMDRLSCWVLREIKTAGSKQLQVLRVLARRADSFDLSQVLRSLAQSQPEAVPELIALNMQDAIGKAREESAALLKKKQERDRQRKNGESEEPWRSVFEHNDHLKPLERILESDPFVRPSLNSLTDRAPRAVVDHLWPVYCEIVGDLADRKETDGEDTSRYREDSVRGISDDYHGPEVFCNAMKQAVVALAAAEPERFLDLVKSAEESDLMSVHQAIAAGLARLTNTHPREVFTYLMGDSRRLLLGGRFRTEVSATCNLVACVSGLDPEDRSALESRIILFFEEELPALWIQDPKSEEYVRKQCGRLLTRVLQAVPVGILSTEGQKRLPGAGGAGGHQDDGIVSRGGMVGPPNTAEELAERSEAELLQIADELPDSTGWNNPAIENRWDEGPERAGGAIQQSRVYETLAEKAPEKFISLLQKLTPGTHELYAAHVIEGIAKSGLGAEALTEAILHLVDCGFESREFRETIARVAEGLAAKHEGLDRRLIDVLLRWLDSEEHPKPNEKEDGDFGGSDSFVFGHATWVSHGGRESLIAALAQVFAVSNEISDSEWFDLIESRLGSEENSDVWANTLARMPWFFREDPARATVLVQEILTRHPSVALHPAGSRSIARIVHLAEPVGQAEAWLEAFEGADLDVFQMLAGELYPLLAIRSPKAKARLGEIVQQGQGVSIPLLRGLIRAIKALWFSHGDIRSVGLEILKHGMASADEQVRSSASSLLSRAEMIVWDDSLSRYIDELCGSKEAILAGGYGLARKLALEVDNAPDEVLRLAQVLVRFGGDRFGDHSTSLPMVPDSILQIAVNLHRIPEFRDEGLDLFEDLLRAGFLGAAQALEALERD